MRLWAHRGSHGTAGPLENTMPAFARALADGADGIELDVHVSADGVPLVFHDDDLTRLTDGADDRRLSELPAAELQSVRLRGGARIPTLEAVLERVARRIPVNVELKDAAAVEPVARLLAGRAADDILLSSFDLRALAAAMERMPRIPRAAVMGTRSLNAAVRLREALPMRALQRIRAAAWHPHAWLVRAGLVDAIHRAGMTVNVWTVNDAQTLKRLQNQGVDGIFTDHPAALRAFSPQHRHPPTR